MRPADIAFARFDFQWQNACSLFNEKIYFSVLFATPIMERRITMNAKTAAMDEWSAVSNEAGHP